MRTALKDAIWATVLMAALPTPTSAQTPTPKDATVISPIFGQLVRFQIPLSFAVVYENTKGTQYTREAVPKGETVERWTQMITVTGYKGLAANANVTPEKFAGGIAGGFKRLCPDSFAGKGLGATEFSGAVAYVAVAGCGTVQGRSETVLIAVVKGVAVLLHLPMGRTRRGRAGAGGRGYQMDGSAAGAAADRALHHRCGRGFALSELHQQEALGEKSWGSLCPSGALNSDLRTIRENTMPLLANHIAVVTGAGSGIGRAIAAGYAKEGARVVALDVNETSAADTAKEIRDAGGKAESFALDVTKRDACVAMARQIADKVGQVSILVNNAGIARRNGMLGAAEAVIDDWESIISINLTGVFNVTHAFLPPLRASKGRIVNIGSIQSFVHLRTPSSPAYTASKHGVLGFTKALAAELGKDGVRVNAIGPGFIETPLNEKVRATNPDLVRIFMDHTPLGRPGKPEDIVGPAIFLASDLAAYVTGTIVMADGGYRTI